jgi:aarF domain-containing kinase
MLFVLLVLLLLQAALRYMVYGRQGIFDADRLIDLLNAFESFAVASQSSRGDMDQEAAAAAAAAHNGNGRTTSSSSNGPFGGGIGIFGPQLIPQLPQLPLPVPGATFGDGTVAAAAGMPGIGLFGLPANRFDLRQQSTLDSQGRLREALR